MELMEKERVHVYMRREMILRIEQQGREKRMSASRIVEAALEEYFKKEQQKRIKSIIGS